MLKDQVIIDLPSIAWANVEDGRLFLIHSVLVQDTDTVLEPVFEIIEREGLKCTSDTLLESSVHLHRQARCRWFDRA